MGTSYYPQIEKNQHGRLFFVITERIHEYDTEYNTVYSMPLEDFLLNLEKEVVLAKSAKGAYALKVPVHF